MENYLLLYLLLSYISLLGAPRLLPIDTHSVCGKFRFMHIISDGAPVNRKAVRFTIALYGVLLVPGTTVPSVRFLTMIKEPHLNSVSVIAPGEIAC